MTLVHPDSKEDIGKSLVAEGLALVEKRREKRFQKMVMDYISAQEAAKKSRVCFIKWTSIVYYLCQGVGTKDKS